MSPMAAVSDILLVGRTLRRIGCDPESNTKNKRIPPTETSIDPMDLVWYEDDRSKMRDIARVVQQHGLVPGRIYFHHK
jgi:hypothetical protein